MGGNRRLEEIEKNRRDFLFVVLYHRLPELNPRKSHWDLLLENPSADGANLLAFALESPFEDWKHERAIRLPNHRRLYLDYEGPISSGRGDVSRVHRGIVRWTSVAQQKLEFALQPQTGVSQGEWQFYELINIPADEDLWELVFKPATLQWPEQRVDLK